MLVGGSAIATDLKLFDLVQGRPQAIDRFLDEISKAGIGDNELGFQLEHSAIMWADFATLSGEDAAILILGGQMASSPGNNRVWVCVVDSYFRPRAWTQAGGGQIFKSATFNHSNNQLITFSQEGYNEGTWVETLTISLDDISIDNTEHKPELSLGRPYYFPLKTLGKAEPNKAE